MKETHDGETKGLTTHAGGRHRIVVAVTVETKSSPAVVSGCDTPQRSFQVVCSSRALLSHPESPDIFFRGPTASAGVPSRLSSSSTLFLYASTPIHNLRATTLFPPNRPESICSITVFHFVVLLAHESLEAIDRHHGISRPFSQLNQERLIYMRQMFPSSDQDPQSASAKMDWHEISRQDCRSRERLADGGERDQGGKAEEHAYHFGRERFGKYNCWVSWARPPPEYAG
jgi:hypothetical protein